MIQPKPPRLRGVSWARGKPTAEDEEERRGKLVRRTRSVSLLRRYNFLLHRLLVTGLNTYPATTKKPGIDMLELPDYKLAA